jgi:sarcosine oxidase
VPTYDTIVIGTGGVGSAALYHLAKRGVKVLGLDRFPPGHDRGSSHGRTRIIRQAYFEHPDYVPLLKRAYELWDELSQRCGQKLYHEIGLLQVSERGGRVVEGVLRAAKEHNLAVDELTGQKAMSRFPGFRFPGYWQAVFERRAGYLNVEDCVLAHLVEAQKLGAELRTGVAVHSWRVRDNRVIVDTNSAQFEADQLVIAAGPWSNSFLTELGIPLTVHRKIVFWYPILDECLSAESGCPAFLFDYGAGIFYGIPRIDDWGLKIARHTGVPDVIDNPLSVDRNVDNSTIKAMDSTVRALLPNVSFPHTYHSVCLYTMSPDENFIVDVHPHYPNVCFAAGLSGHGFKFTCVLGEILADLALEGKTRHPIEFLNCRRFGTIT